MRRRFHCFSLGSYLPLAIVLAIGSSAAWGKDFQARKAESLVRTAMTAEAQGDRSERIERLEAALAANPDFAPAQWYLGRVKLGSKWVEIDALASHAANDSRLEEYGSERSRVGQTLAGHLHLARWCDGQGLKQQARAHLTAALDFAPNNPAILRQLGFQQVGGRWVTREQLEESTQESDQRVKDLVAWMPRMQEFAKGYRQRSSRKRRAHVDRLLAIRDVAAIPALEKLARANRDAAPIVLQALGNIDHHRATLAIARLAVESSNLPFQTAAAALLRKRNIEHYVPAMLGAMQSPYSARSVAVRDGRRTRFLVSFTSETQDEREAFVVRSQVGRSSQDRQMKQLQLQASARNQGIWDANLRIANVLRLTTGAALPAQPSEWWNWWNEINEVFIEGAKPLRLSGSADAAEQLVRIDRSEQMQRERASQRAAEIQRWQSESQATTPRRRDCLAPGTLIWTATGPVAVERMMPGDLVLAQDIETGELALKPVLKKTLRPATTLVRIAAGGDTIQASGGHPFWVTGEGWVRARELKSGMLLHGAEGPVEIRSVSSGVNVQTHNLIVADFHSYLVGADKVLSHDNTVREATSAKLPGFVPALAEDGIQP